MPKILLVFTFLLVAMAVLVLFPDDQRLFAVSGCCKQRSSYQGRWNKTNMSFEDCQRLNQGKDKDDMFDERGLVWWDVKCP